MNRELPDVQAGFRKGRGTGDEIANIRWIIEKAREFQKNIYFCFIDYAKAFDCVDHNKLWKILKEMGIPAHLTCLLKNLYAGQEATVRTGLQSMGLQRVRHDWATFIFSPCPWAPKTPQSMLAPYDIGGVFWGFSLKEISWEETLNWRGVWSVERVTKVSWDGEGSHPGWTSLRGGVQAPCWLSLGNWGKEPVLAAGVGAGRDPWWLPQGIPVLGGGWVLQRDVGWRYRWCHSIIPCSAFFKSLVWRHTCPCRSVSRLDEQSIHIWGWVWRDRGKDDNPGHSFASWKKAPRDFLQA